MHLDEAQNQDGNLLEDDTAIQTHDAAEGVEDAEGNDLAHNQAVISEEGRAEHQIMDLAEDDEVNLMQLPLVRTICKSPPKHAGRARAHGGDQGRSSRCLSTESTARSP